MIVETTKPKKSIFRNPLLYIMVAVIVGLLAARGLVSTATQASQNTGTNQATNINPIIIQQQDNTAYQAFQNLTGTVTILANFIGIILAIIVILLAIIVVVISVLYFFFGEREPKSLFDR